LLGDQPTWLIKRNAGQENLVLKEIGKTYFLYVARDCHLEEGVIDRFLGHRFLEKVVMRVTTDSIFPLMFCQDPRWFDLSDLVVDQHLHVSMARAISEPNHISRDEPVASTSSSELVVARGVTMTREEKASARRARRRDAAAERAAGRKVKSSWQVPIRFKGLTTQAYHDMVRQEWEDLVEWVHSQGLKAQPSDVRQFMSSRAGAEQWNNIHALALKRRELAQKQLDKLNSFLRTLGLRVPLEIDARLIDRMAKARSDAQSRIEKQKQAAAARADPGLLARTAWQEAKAKQDELEFQRFRESSLNKGWGDDLYDDLDDTSLPDLDW